MTTGKRHSAAAQSISHWESATRKKAMGNVILVQYTTAPDLPIAPSSPYLLVSVKSKIYVPELRRDSMASKDEPDAAPRQHGEGNPRRC